MRRELGLGLDWLALLALGIAGATAYGLFLHSKPGAPAVFGAIVALALVASIRGRHRARPDERVPWLCTSVALAGFLAADAIWWRYSAGASQAIRLVDDGVMLASYVPLGLAALSIASSHERRTDHSSWLDAGILTALTGLIAWSVLVEPRLHGSKIATADRLATVAYPLAGLFVLAFVFRLAFSRSGRSWAATSLMLGIALILGSEVDFRWHDTRAALGSSSRVDIALLIGYLLVGFAALLSPAGWRGASGDRIAMGRGRLAVVLLAAVVPQVVLVSNLERRNLLGLDTLNVSVWVSSLVMVLVAVRLWRLLKRVRRAEAHRGEARLAALIHNSADAIFLVDRECVIAFASRSSEGLWQRNVKSLIGTSLFDSFVDDDRHALARRLENLVAMPPASTLPL